MGSVALQNHMMIDLKAEFYKCCPFQSAAVDVKAEEMKPDAPEDTDKIMISQTSINVSVSGNSQKWPYKGKQMKKSIFDGSPGFH